MCGCECGCGWDVVGLGGVSFSSVSFIFITSSIILWENKKILNFEYFEILGLFFKFWVSGTCVRRVLRWLLFVICGSCENMFTFLDFGRVWSFQEAFCFVTDIRNMENQSQSRFYLFLLPQK